MCGACTSSGSSPGERTEPTNTASSDALAKDATCAQFFKADLVARTNFAEGLFPPPPANPVNVQNIEPVSFVTRACHSEPSLSPAVAVAAIGDEVLIEVRPPCGHSWSPRQCATAAQLREIKAPAQRIGRSGSVGFQSQLATGRRLGLTPLTSAQHQSIPQIVHVFGLSPVRAHAVKAALAHDLAVRATRILVP